MTKDPAFTFYTSDFLVGTMYMSNEEVGIYIRLLCSQHQHGGIISKNVFETATNGHKLIREKFVECEEGYYNERLMREMIKRRNKSNNLSANALQRWNNSNAIASNRDMPSETENENEKEILNTELINIFTKLYSNYPKKVGKKQALRHFKASVKNKADCDDIKKALDHYLRSKRVAKGFIMNASTWFNNWQDWVDFEEPYCQKCKGKGVYVSSTGYEIKCDCEDGRKL